MLKLSITTVIVVLVCSGPVRAQEPDGMKTGLVFAKTKGGVLVAGVKGGSLSSYMGFREGDAVLKYSFNGVEKDVKSADDLSELLAGKPGKYVVILQSKDETRRIAGSVGVREAGAGEKMTLYFLRDRPSEPPLPNPKN